ncbi:DUF1385 domain-containing protein [Desulfovibrio inopinatus]|uniref:DUF1385 domain-containing protein n=1 Tax=Desulfovibrio inopinatus TaxID=102109 RepID=UPI00040BF909|nr:DUF1385 domain-containing protein [Desulfovibrio inopinatus]
MNWILRMLLAAQASVGGQAVMEGVMMRSQNRLAIAVRKPDGEIVVQTRPWFSLTSSPLLQKPFLRGFPVLLETLVNGISALNYSAKEAMDEESGELKPWALVLTMAASIAFALGLFVVVPHIFSLAMGWLGLSGDAKSLTFHMWDGLFKMMIFFAYVIAISFLPDIRRVFQYHGAEHKVIWAYETGVALTPKAVRAFSRLHPRCGTAFLLFVLAVSIVLYTFLVPLILNWYAPENEIARQAFIIGVKLALMVPISSVAFEIIKFSGKFHDNIVCRAMSCPGLFMQLLTTHEPDDEQLEVAIEALKGALGRECDAV